MKEERINLKSLPVKAAILCEKEEMAFLEKLNDYKKLMESLPAAPQEVKKHTDKVFKDLEKGNFHKHFVAIPAGQLAEVVSTKEQIIIPTKGWMMPISIGAKFIMMTMELIDKELGKTDKTPLWDAYQKTSAGA